MQPAERTVTMHRSRLRESDTRQELPQFRKVPGEVEFSETEFARGADTRHVPLAPVYMLVENWFMVLPRNRFMKSAGSNPCTPCSMGKTAPASKTKAAGSLPTRQSSSSPD